jgi:hypothetical protein
MATAIQTGKVSHTTKTGRLAKMFRTEILSQGKSFDFAAFGNQLMGKTVKALSIAQESNFDDLAPLANKDTKIVFTPYVHDTPAKNRADVFSVRLLIQPSVVSSVESDSNRTVMMVSSTTDPLKLGKRIHDSYLRSQNAFMLKCLGGQQTAIALQAMAMFNEKVASHKLRSYLSTEEVRDTHGQEFTRIRGIVFHVDVVPSESVALPE